MRQQMHLCQLLERFVLYPCVQKQEKCYVTVSVESVIHTVSNEFAPRSVNKYQSQKHIMSNHW